MGLIVPGCDYSFARPSPAGLKKAGIKFAIRYLSHTPGKNLTKAERDALWSQGISIGLVWETTATRTLDGFAAGKADALEAAKQSYELGMADVPIFFGIDFDVTNQWNQLNDYFRGCNEAIGVARTGAYGEGDAIDFLVRSGRLAKNGRWQTYAWSRGRVSPHATLYQYRNGVTIAGGQVDLCKGTNAPGGFGTRARLSHVDHSNMGRVARWRMRLRYAQGLLRLKTLPPVVRQALGSYAKLLRANIRAELKK